MNELERRIKEAVEARIGPSLMRDAWEEIEPIIEEAKKEFPLPKKEELPLDYSARIIKWFAKWLGESNQLKDVVDEIAEM